MNVEYLYIPLTVMDVMFWLATPKAERDKHHFLLRYLPFYGYNIYINYITKEL